MPASVRQNVHWKVVAIFLIGDVLVTALLGNSPTSEGLHCISLGGLIAQPMLLGFWLGLARGPVLDRLVLTLGCAAAGASAFSLGIAWVSMGLPAGVVGLFVVAGLGATTMAGGFFRASRFLLGVLTLPAETADRPPASSAPEARADPRPMADPGDTNFSDTTSLEANFSDASPWPDRPGAPSVAQELQFSVGYIVAMTSAIAILISALRWVGWTIPGLRWPIVLGFGCTFFVYSTLAACLVMASILATRRRFWSAMVAVLYTLLVPPATLPIVSVWAGKFGSLSALTNVYCYALSLSLTLALVATLWRRLGYRLCHGWL